MEKRKISFCTVCRNRLHHLKETLPVNIRDNEDYEELEFIVLDYNSNDGLEEYIRANMGEYLENGRLVYYRTVQPDFFHRSHARNTAFKLATGDLICNIDADNFTGRNFAAYIDNVFREETNVCLSAIGRSKQLKRDVLGRICVDKAQFLEAGGYDETMSAYGFEDYDFLNRIEMLGARRIIIENAAYLNAIDHPDEERISEEYYAKHLSSLFLSYIDASSTEFLLLLDNNEFIKATMLDMATMYTSEVSNAVVAHNYTGQFSFLQKDWIRGKWDTTATGFQFIENDIEDQFIYSNDLKHYKSIRNNMIYYEIKDLEMISQSIFFCSQITNRMRMEYNKSSGNIVANNRIFGVAVVYKNFDYKTPLFV